MQKKIADTLVLIVVGAVAFITAQSNPVEVRPEKELSMLSPPPIGVKCQVALRADTLGAIDRIITPRHTDGSINGSKDSVWGKLVRIDEHWVVVSLADCRVPGRQAQARTSGRLPSHDERGHRQPPPLRWSRKPRSAQSEAALFSALHSRLNRCALSISSGLIVVASSPFAIALSARSNHM
jgi:hypothetical protein